MNKIIWTLIIKTSLPNVTKSKDDLKLNVFCFDDFEEAKKALREKLKEFAYSKNSMFDGNGNIIMLDDYIAESFEYEDLKSDSTFLSAEKMNVLKDYLLNIFNGKDNPLSALNVMNCDDGCMISLNITEDSIELYGFDEGPINGYDPTIKTNMFDMSKENNYYLYIDDMFGQDCSSELYIDLIKSEMSISK